LSGSLREKEFKRKVREVFDGGTSKEIVKVTMFMSSRYRYHQYDYGTVLVLLLYRNIEMASRYFHASHPITITTASLKPHRVLQ
jgi:hypothetical protein